MLRRAIAESEAMAQAQAQSSGSGSGSGSGPGSRDDGGTHTPQAAPSWQQHRVYDDEDEELQAALRASLETVPAGFRVPSPPPVSAPPAPQPVAAPPQERTPDALAPPPIERQPSSEFETESEADSEAMEAEQPSLEEIRRRRLAKFGA